MVHFANADCPTRSKVQCRSHISTPLVPMLLPYYSLIPLWEGRPMMAASGDCASRLVSYFCHKTVCCRGVHLGLRATARHRGLVGAIIPPREMPWFPLHGLTTGDGSSRQDAFPSRVYTMVEDRRLLSYKCSKCSLNRMRPAALLYPVSQQPPFGLSKTVVLTVNGLPLDSSPAVHINGPVKLP